MPKGPVAILGASGLVSQRMQQRLSMHPWFELVAVAGQSSGMTLSEVNWHLDEPRPAFIDHCDLTVKTANGERVLHFLVIFDGATSLLTVYIVPNLEILTTIDFYAVTCTNADIQVLTD